MVMKNSILVQNLENKITLKYDLKGSMIKRKVLSKNIHKLKTEQFMEEAVQNVLKDRDLVCINENRQKLAIKISYRDKVNLLLKIQKDTDFLASQNIMDYSLLIAVE